MQHRDAIRFCKRTHCLTEAVTDALEQCWRWDWITKVLGQERNYLAAHLELGDVPIQVHPVKAFEVQHDMTFEYIVDVGCPGHPDTSRADRQTVLHRKPAHRIQRPELGGLRCVRRRTSLIAGAVLVGNVPTTASATPTIVRTVRPTDVTKSAVVAPTTRPAATTPPPVAAALAPTRVPVLPQQPLATP